MHEQEREVREERPTGKGQCTYMHELGVEKTWAAKHEL